MITGSGGDMQQPAPHICVLEVVPPQGPDLREGRRKEAEHRVGIRTGLLHQPFRTCVLCDP